MFAKWHKKAITSRLLTRHFIEYIKMQNGSICFFIQWQLEPLCFQSSICTKSLLHLYVQIKMYSTKALQIYVIYNQVQKVCEYMYPYYRKFVNTCTHIIESLWIHVPILQKVCEYMYPYNRKFVNTCTHITESTRVLFNINYSQKPRHTELNCCAKENS